ncbi:MAG: 1-(5-phosphoribosyl)-5-[(5-phosphoribosylamino)methylideneamino]imidazole-4-carboxamide isomerase [Armatimonadota bacterium]
MEIIPAIDIRGGKCVRLIQGDYAREMVFGDDPVEMARHWEEHGATRLHVVDLDGAREGEPRNLEMVERISGAVRIPIELGGGMRTEEMARRALVSGVDRVIVGTAALDKAAARRFAEALGNALVAGIDARDGRVAVRGWLETSDIRAVDLGREMAALGVKWIVFTDIGSDGMLQGPNVTALREMAESLEASIIASGGITTVDDVKAVRDAGAAAAIIGRALYEGRLSLEEAMKASC